MALKQRQLVPQRDFAEALTYVGSSISEVAKATGVPRAYLSDLKNRGVALRREHDEKLHAYLGEQGFEFEDRPASRERNRGDDEARQRTVGIVGTVDQAIPDEALVQARRRLEDNEARLLAILKRPVQRGASSFCWFGDELTTETQEQLKEAERLLAENYFVARLLRGWAVFEVPAAPAQSQTIRELLLTRFAPALEESDLLPASPKASDGKPPAGKKPNAQPKREGGIWDL